MNEGISLQVRLDDCDVFGYVKNSAYMNYVQYALAKTLIQLGFAQDWMDDSALLWQLKTSAVEYRQAAVFGDLLHATFWLEQADVSCPAFGCEIVKSDFSGQYSVETIARTLTEWQRISKIREELVPFPQHVFSLFPRAQGKLPHQFELPVDEGKSRKYLWEKKVMQSELGPGGRILPQAIYNWLEDAVFEVFAEAGWPVKKQRIAGVFTFQKRHDTEFFNFPDTGATIQIVSHLLNVREARATWLQEVLVMPEQNLCVLNYSTEIFVDRHGHPSPPSPMMLKDIQALDL
ncbi:MAG: acyl-[acyl-carrier-protein] thioesterase [bacterium]|nr:acyl-[acyl-carrier-protein] thioesterase [bacterium]